MFHLSRKNAVYQQLAKPVVFVMTSCMFRM